MHKTRPNLTNRIMLNIARLMAVIFFLLTGLTHSWAQSPLCSSAPTMFDYEYISSVTINGATIAGDTGFSGPGYIDNTGSTLTSMVAGQSYPVSITVKTDGGTYQEYVKVWIDFNGKN